MKRSKTQAGFSMLELAVVVMVIAVLSAILLHRLAAMTEDVERVTFNGVKSNIQAQLTLQVSYWFAAQKQVSADALKMTNPMALIPHPPVNYLGEITVEDLRAALPERWYYVPKQHWLVYKVKRSAQLMNNYEERNLIPFQLRAKFSNPQANQGVAVGVELTPVFGFEWRKVNDS